MPTVKITKKIVTEIDQVIEVKELCDKCNQEIKTDLCVVDNCEVSINRGNRYPGTADYIQRYLNLCPTCSRALEQMLIDQGYNFQEQDINY